jgi:hypothetical protein
MKNLNNLTEGQEKAIALLQHLETDFFVVETEETVYIYEGTEEEAREQFINNIEVTEEVDTEINFQIFCSNNFTEIEEYSSDNYNNDYLVLTDSEADDKWEESLNNYLEECIYPELIGNLSNYFDDEKWKKDARYDGRGHSLATYDGNEYEESVNGTTYYIFRIN